MADNARCVTPNRPIQVSDRITWAPTRVPKQPARCVTPPPTARVAETITWAPTRVSKKSRIGGESD